MKLLLFSIAILLLCSFLSLLFKDEERQTLTSCIGTSIASVIGLAYSIISFGEQEVVFLFKTSIPNITLAIGSDCLTKFFLIVIFGLSSLVGIYGVDYIKGQKKYLSTTPFFPLLVSSMALVTMARDGLSFIVFWEVMSLSSYFLVVSEHENKEVQNAGWIYLIATHLATAFLMLFFILLGKASGSLLFSDFVHHPQLLPGFLFIFALIGFGTKAGFFPVHLWLPHAHPAAPSHISALMSGVMIKTGIYGILRSLTFLGVPSMWWGILLIIIGILSAVLGVLYAIMQHDLKRLLAYHSVENIGIIAIGLGLGLVGIAGGNPLVSVLGFGGAMFHVLNHSIFKGLLFLGAGGIFHATHTLAIDKLGGLFKKMPLTGITFLIAALSICGLPPFNGFISEWLIYVGLFQGSLSLFGYQILLLVAGIVGIVFAGGLAVACFTKVFGIIFLGEPRNVSTEDCHDPSKYFLIPMLVLSGLCVAIGLYPKEIWRAVFMTAGSIYPALSHAQVNNILTSLNFVTAVFASAIVAVILFYLFYRRVFHKKPVLQVLTWDCGYAFPTSRMQYTASSFAGPIAAVFKPMLQPDPHGKVEDLAQRQIFSPVFSWINSVILLIRRRKKSTIQSYLSLIFVALLVLFIWEVWFGI